MKRKALFAIVVTAAATLTGVDGVAGQGAAAAALPPVFRSLEGSWSGTGTLLGQTAEFTMEWSAEGDGFVRLTFTNAFVDTSGNRTPVLHAEAVYLVDGATAQGVWMDSRPQRIRLESTIHDTRIETVWTAESERGRTEYVVVSPDEVVVRDFVESDGVLRPFGEATYRRR